MRKRRTTKRRASTVKRRTSVARRPVRRVRRKSNPIKAVRRSPVRRRVSKRVVRRRNPIAARGIVDKMIMPAAIAASGAIALDVAWAYLPIPANLKTGYVKHLSKGVGAVAMGWLASKVVKKKTADELAAGAMTVVIYNAAREMIASVAPQVQMDGMGEYVSGIGYAGAGMVRGDYASLPGDYAGSVGLPSGSIRNSEAASFNQMGQYVS